jgi:hypothetical protein
LILKLEHEHICEVGVAVVEVVVVGSVPLKMTPLLLLKNKDPHLQKGVL